MVMSTYISHVTQHRNKTTHNTHTWDTIIFPQHCFSTPLQHASQWCDRSNTTFYCFSLECIYQRLHFRSVSQGTRARRTKVRDWSWTSRRDASRTADTATTPCWCVKSRRIGVGELAVDQRSCGRCVSGARWADSLEAAVRLKCVCVCM